MEDFNTIIIRKGDSLHSLFGPDWETVYWNDVNKDFRESCPNPNIIKSGIPIYVPKKKYDCTTIIYSKNIFIELNSNRTRILTATENLTKLTSEAHLKSDKVIMICDYEIGRNTCRILNKDNSYVFGCRNVNHKLFMALYDFPKTKQESVYLFGKNITDENDISELSEYSMLLTKYPNCSFIQFGANPKINSYSLPVNNDLLIKAIKEFAKTL